jgi:hypothetical protein
MPRDKVEWIREDYNPKTILIEKFEKKEVIYEFCQKETVYLVAVYK